MLVLTRKRREDIIIADEITLTVEDITDSDGNHVSGARVRLGFECPEHIDIDRGELRRRGQGTKHYGGKRREPEPPLPGRAREFSEAVIKLQIEVPRMVPVCVNGLPVAVPDPDSGAAAGSNLLYRIACVTGDRLTICNNIVIQPVSVHRFELFDAPAADV